MEKKVRVGIIGCGGIANGKHLPSIKKLAERGVLEIVAFCDLIEEKAAKAAKEYGTPDAKVYTDYKELLKVADIVTVHVPLTDQTRDMISAAELATMKKTALVINCSRGGIVNEADLCAALRAGTIAGAGTDVFCNEPPKPDDPLLNTPNLIVSPHSAAQTREAVIKMANMCVDGCLAVIRGEK